MIHGETGGTEEHTLSPTPLQGKFTASGTLVTGLYGSDVVCWGPLGCTDPIQQIMMPILIVDDGSCTYVLGCTDPNATNYDSTTQDDGSCIYV